MLILQGYHGGNGQGTGWAMANTQLLTIDIFIGLANICLLLVLLYMYLKGFRGPGMGTPIFFLNIIEFFALCILVYVTRE